jgi:hypothetical protein
MTGWIRRCQECGHKQQTKRPDTYKGDSWRDLRCKKCGSIGLDYGQELDVVSNAQPNQRKDAQ